MNIVFWKKIFKYGAYWNWFFAAIGLIFPGFTRMVMGIEGGGAIVLFQAGFFWAVALFGLAYWWVSRDPLGPASAKLVQLGIMGKLLVFAYFAHYYFTGTIRIFAFAAAVGDFIFSALFGLFLIGSRVKSSNSS